MLLNRLFLILAFCILLLLSSCSNPLYCGNNTYSAEKNEDMIRIIPSTDDGFITNSLKERTELIFYDSNSEIILENIVLSGINDNSVGHPIDLKNYKYILLNDKISEIKVRDDEEFLIIPFNDFSNSSQGEDYIFYVVYKHDYTIKEMLDNPQSLKKEQIIFIEKIYVQDLNGDNLDDLMIEFIYPIGFGKFAGHVMSLYEIYFQTDTPNNYFNYELELSEEINNWYAEETILINNDEEGMSKNYIPDINLVIEKIKQKAKRDSSINK